TKWLMTQFDGDRFGSTRSTSVVVRTLVAQAKVSEAGDARIVVSTAGVEVAREQLTKARASEPAIHLYPKVQLRDRTAAFEVAQDGAGVFFHTIALKVPVRSKNLPAEGAGGLSIRRSYRKLSGSTGAYNLGKESASFSS